jgi:hypothetical protein
MHELWLIGELYILQADQLTGPWNRSSTGGIENKFAVIKPHGKNFTYNLFAHPHFKKDEEILISYNVNNSDFWPIFDDTRNYRARFFWMDVEKAVNLSIPDTLDYFDSVMGTDDNLLVQKDHHSTFRVAGGKLYIDGIVTPSLLEIYSLDGKKFMSRRVSGGEVIPLVDIPNNLLLIRLTGSTKSQVQKIVNQN